MTREDWRALGQAVALVSVTGVAIAALLFAVDALEGNGAVVWAWVVWALGIAGITAGLIAATAYVARRNEDRCWKS